MAQTSNKKRYAYQREYYWKKQGIKLTYPEYEAMLDAQQGLCGLCERHQDTFKKALCPDHNHKTGQIRDLLCTFCNGKLLKYLRDRPKLARQVARYLLKWFPDGE